MIVLSPKPPILKGRRHWRPGCVFIFLRTSELFGTSTEIFGYDRVLYEKSWHSQYKNLTPLSQKKLTGIHTDGPIRSYNSAFTRGQFPETSPSNRFRGQVTSRELSIFYQKIYSQGPKFWSLRLVLRTQTGLN